MDDNTALDNLEKLILIFVGMPDHVAFELRQRFLVTNSRQTTETYLSGLSLSFCLHRHEQNARDHETRGYERSQ
jgi:hypothetical protein